MAKPIRQYWILVVRDDLGVLSVLEANQEHWWCVDRQSNPGDRAFIYRPLRGLYCMVEILSLAESRSFCNGYAMATGQIRMLKQFGTYLSAKRLKTAAVIRAEKFIRQNFQGTAFLISNPETPKTIL